MIVVCAHLLLLLRQIKANLVDINFDYTSTTSGADVYALDPCLPDPCGGNGFCSSLSDSTYQCQCMTAYTGDNCDEETDAMCETSDCNDRGSCSVTIAGTNTWHWELESACECDNGWSQESNCAEFVGCEGVDCGDEGTCTDVDMETGEVTCECNTGYSGEFCATKLELCTEAHLRQAVEDLWEIDESAALDCSYVAPWTIFLTPGLVICDCLNTIAWNLGEDYLESYECLVDWTDVQTPYTAWNMYCNNCSDTDLTVMEEEIEDYSPTCEYFIEDRVSKPLYERMGLKCSCMESLGETYDEAAEWVTCPFTNHMSSSDMISWQNCEQMQTCDFPSIYFKITSELAKINKGAMSVCQAALASLFMEYPDDLRYSSFGPVECQCWDYLHQYCPDCIEWLTCAPVTFHITVMSEEFDRICYDDLSVARECLWAVNWVASTISTAGHPTEGSVCWEAFRYGAALGYMDDTLEGMICDCYGAANDAGISFAQSTTPSMIWETCGSLIEDTDDFQWSTCNYVPIEREEQTPIFGGNAGQTIELDVLASFKANNQLSSTGVTLVTIFSLALMCGVGYGSMLLGTRAANIECELEMQRRGSSIPISRGGEISEWRRYSVI